MSSVIHLKGLNGLRAIAAIAVVISHIVLESRSLGLHPFLFGSNSEGNPNVWLLANYGVTVFFCLSGFLITYLLLVEKEKHGKIEIGKFYFRRILRIWPLYYLYLLIVIVLLIIMNVPFDNYQTLFYIFFAANIPFILSKAIVFIAHYWSIGVEEQFYLFWPWIANRSNKNLFRVTLLLCSSLVLLKLFFWVLELRFGYTVPYKVLSVSRFQCMLIGCLGAILYYEKNNRFIKFSTHISIQILSWLVLASVALNKFRGAALGDEIISFITVFLIIGQITSKNSLINLDQRIFNFLGKISYGIYVIHPLVILLYIRLIGDLPLPTTLKYIFVFCMIILTTVLLAHLSYVFFEKRFLILKEKFSIVRSSNENRQA